MTRLWWTRATNPFNGLDAFGRQVSSLLGANRWSRFGGAAEFPPLNVSDHGGELELTAELPGMKLDDIDVAIVGDVLTIRGERRQAEEFEQATPHRRERAFGGFARSIQLPQHVSGDEAQARYTDGVLTVLIPKAPETKPHRVEIRTPDA